jgi:hypothetical protein
VPKQVYRLARSRAVPKGRPGAKRSGRTRSWEWRKDARPSASERLFLQCIIRQLWRAIISPAHDVSGRFIDDCSRPLNRPLVTLSVIVAGMVLTGMIGADAARSSPPRFGSSPQRGDCGVVWP